MPVKRTVCPGCGSAYIGKRCRSCGYEPFPNAANTSPATPARKKEKRTYPLLGFLILLLLIWALLPGLRQWGQKLEAMEDAAQNSSHHSSDLPRG